MSNDNVCVERKIEMPDLQFLAKFIPPMELKTLKGNLRGEEGEYFRGMLVDLEKRIRNMPALRTEKDLDAPVYLHYFIGGCDWWISSLDPEDMIGYGYAVLNQDWENAESGDIWLPEIIDLRSGPFQAELDLYWNTKTTLREVMARNPDA